MPWPFSPAITLGSRGPFLGSLDLGLLSHRLPLRRLDTHLYVVGRSGQGKSKFLEHFLWQLIHLNQGCGLIDPHGDLANDLLARLAAERENGRSWLDDPANRERFLYVEPGRDDYYLPMNVLAGPEDDYTKAVNIIEAFQRTWSQSLLEAPQFKNTALHGLLLLLEQDLTLVELPRLFMDKDFRESLLARSQNGDVVAFFRQRFARWGREQSLRIESLLNKVTALTLNAHLRRMLGAGENRLNLRRMMDTGRILIVNLGTCDRETRNLLGSLLTVGLEQAALSRISLDPTKRRPWYCVLDEFQWFVANEGSAQVVAQMLSEVRKMGLRLCLAHQGWHQLDNQRLEGALDQAQVKVVFGTGAQTAQVIADELFTPNLHQIKHEIDDLVIRERTHPYYTSLLEQREAFVQQVRDQPRRRALLAAASQGRVLPLRTLPVPKVAITPQQLEEIKRDLLRQTGAAVTGSGSQMTVYPSPTEAKTGAKGGGVPAYRIIPDRPFSNPPAASPAATASRQPTR